MGDLFFIMRMVFYTLFLTMCMQVKIGNYTIEDQVIEFTHQSSFAGEVQKVAEGAIRVLRIGFAKVSKNVGETFAESKPQSGQRIRDGIDKTKNYLQEVFGAEEKPQPDTNVPNEEVIEPLNDTETINI